MKRQTPDSVDSLCLKPNKGFIARYPDPSSQRPERNSPDVSAPCSRPDAADPAGAALATLTGRLHCLRSTASAASVHQRCGPKCTLLRMTCWQGRPPHHSSSPDILPTLRCSVFAPTWSGHLGSTCRRYQTAANWQISPVGPVGMEGVWLTLASYFDVHGRRERIWLAD